MGPLVIGPIAWPPVSGCLQLSQEQLHNRVMGPQKYGGQVENLVNGIASATSELCLIHSKIDIFKSLHEVSLVTVTEDDHKLSG